MATFPSGTVTFAFTDIEGSTELLKHLGDGYGDVLAKHRRIVRETFGAANGVEIDTQGDAFFFAFERARDAVAAAVHAQRAHASSEWPEDAVVRVRIGLHTGEPAVGDEGYLGLDVVRAARICTAAHGGNVLLSESTRSLIGTTLPEGVSVFPRGERHLKGIDEPERIYELAIEGVETDEREGPAPAAATTTPVRDDVEQVKEKHLEDLGARLAERIQDRVASALERSLGKVGASSSSPAGEDADVEGLATRASLDEQIRARVAAALKAKGIAHDKRG